MFRGRGDDLKAVTEGSIKVLQRLIDNTSDDDPEKPDLLFRMAELYFEQEHYYDFKARELDEKMFSLQEQGKTAEADKVRAQQKAYEQKEKDWLKAAVKEYLAVTSNPKYNGYKRMDQVLYSLAFLLTQQKREDLARPIFKRLIKDFPNSTYIPDAYLAFGEYFFEEKQMEHALQFYDKVLQFTDSKVYGYAHYKEGWVYLNLQDYKKALEVFVSVIGEQQKGAKDKNKIQLLKEARKDAVRSYAYIGTADKAWNFFQKIGGDMAPTMFEQLGELYNAMGKFDESIRVYRELIKNTPESLKLCNWQTEILKNTLSKTGSRATPEAVKELQRLSAVWDKYQGMKDVKQEAVDECRDNTGGSLRELATTWHKEAQKTGVKETYDLAQYLYKEYLKQFPKERDVYPMTFYYGELLFKLERFCDSAPIYTAVVKLDTTDKAKYRNESAYAAVISWKNCLNVDDAAATQAAEANKLRGDKKIKEDDPKKKKSEADKQKEREAELAKYQPKEIPPTWKTMLDAFDTYVQYVPNAPELVTIKYRRARVYYEHNHFAEAAPLFEDIVKNHTKDDLAIYSANLYFDSLNVLHKYEDLEMATATYCTYPDLLKDEDFKKQCAIIKNGIRRKKIEGWEADGKFRLAADEYMKLVAENPSDPRLDELYYNASILYERAKAVGLAISTRQQLIKVMPKSPLAKKSQFLLGRAYQDIAAYQNAAELYEEFTRQYPGEKSKPGEKPVIDASTALFTAAFFRRGLGEIDKSIEDTNNFIRIYGTRPEYVDRSAGVFFGLAQIYEAQGKEKLEKHLRDYLKQWTNKGGVDREIVANVKLGEMKWKESCPVEGVNGACVEIIRVRASSATKVAEADKEKKAKKGKKVKKKGFVMPAQCGPPTKTKTILHDRIPAKAKEAQAFFTAALKLYAGGAALKKVPGKDDAEKDARRDAMMYHVAQARMMQGDEQYEKLIAMKIPDKLDFTPPDNSGDSKAAKAKAAAQKKKVEESVKKFTGWFEGKTKQMVTTQAIFQQIIQMKQAHWAIAAAARIGQIYQDFSGQLYTAPIPAPPKTPEGITDDEFKETYFNAYCDAMTDKAEPLEGKAIEGLTTCLGTSTRLSWFNEWSALCELELNQIKPGEFQIASEIRAQPGYYDRRSDQAPIVTEIK